MAHEARQGFGLMPQELFAAGFNSVNNPEWMWGMQIKVDQSTNLRFLFFKYGSLFNRI